MERKLSAKTGNKLTLTKSSDQTLSVFCQQLSTLLSSGLDLPEALQVLAQGIKQKAFRKDIEKTADFIQQGYAFSEAAAACPGSFPKLFVQMIRAAEMAGGLTLVLDQLSAYYERQGALHSQLLQVTLYPIIVLLLSVTILIVLMVKVVPIFVGIIQSMAGEVPVMTQVLVRIGEIMAKGWPVFLLIILITVLAIKILKRKPKYALVFGKIALRMPLIGAYFSDNACMQLAQTLSILLNGGVDLPEGLEVCSTAASNGAVSEALKFVRHEIIQGRPMYLSMEKAGVFPLELCQMVRVGEQTGTLKDTMDKAADFYLKSFTRRTKLLMTVLEPAVLIFVGIMVLLVLMAVMQPIYQVYQLYMDVM